MALRERQVTAAEFETFISRREHADRRFELIDGEIVETVPTQLHALIVHLLSGHLFTFLLQHPIGWAFVEARYQMPEDAFNALIPDVSFVSDRSRPVVARGAAPYMPDLAVEVQSPDDSLRMLLDKAVYYLAHGARMVWLIYPEKRLIEVLTATERLLLTENEQLSGGGVLPGLSVRVGDVFPPASAG